MKMLFFTCFILIVYLFVHQCFSVLGSWSRFLHYHSNTPLPHPVTSFSHNRGEGPHASPGGDGSPLLIPTHHSGAGAGVPPGGGGLPLHHAGLRDCPQPTVLSGDSQDARHHQGTADKVKQREGTTRHQHGDDSMWGLFHVL